MQGKAGRGRGCRAPAAAVVAASAAAVVTVLVLVTWRPWIREWGQGEASFFLLLLRSPICVRGRTAILER